MKCLLQVVLLPHMSFDSGLCLGREAPIFWRSRRPKNEKSSHGPSLKSGGPLSDRIELTTLLLYNRSIGLTDGERIYY